MINNEVLSEGDVVECHLGIVLGGYRLAIRGNDVGNETNHLLMLGVAQRDA